MESVRERLVFDGAAVTDAFRFWFRNPSVDYGYALQFAPGAQLGTRFMAAERERGEHGPVLTITYRLP